jgi:ABC-type Fe3+ transport system permease subunit
MLILRIAVVVILAVIAIVLVIKNLERWSKGLRRYMIGQSTKAWGDASEWERPWTIYLSKALVIFFGGMFILLVYVICFSQST